MSVALSIYNKLPDRYQQIIPVSHDCDLSSASKILIRASLHFRDVIIIS